MIEQPQNNPYKKPTWLVITLGIVLTILTFLSFYLDSKNANVKYLLILALIGAVIAYFRDQKLKEVDPETHKRVNELNYFVSKFMAKMWVVMIVVLTLLVIAVIIIDRIKS